MRKFIPFDKKIDSEIDLTEMLLHSVSYLDHAAEIAVQNNNAKLMLKVYKASLEASDRLMTLALHLGEEKEEDDTIIKRDEGEFGFKIPTPQSECDIEADDE